MITPFVCTSCAQRAVTPYAPQVYEFQTVFYSSSLKIHSSCTLYTLKRAGLLVACITTLYNSRNIQIRGVEKFSAMPDNFEHHESSTCQAPCINMECWKKKKSIYFTDKGMITFLSIHPLSKISQWLQAEELQYSVVSAHVPAVSNSYLLESAHCGHVCLFFFNS